MYEIDPIASSKTRKPQNVLGGEICAWGEGMDSGNLIFLAFTRGMAVAERLWSPARVNLAGVFRIRSLRYRCLAIRRGLMQNTGPLEVDYCAERSAAAVKTVEYHDYKQVAAAVSSPKSSFTLFGISVPSEPLAVAILGLILIIGIAIFTLEFIKHRSRHHENVQ